MRDRLAIVSLLLFAVVVIGVAAFFEITSPDLFWHLRMGHDLIHHGLTPFRDHYSFTLPDEKIIMVAWPFQIVASTLYDICRGFTGIVILRLALWSASLVGTFKVIRLQSSSPLALALAFSFFLCAILFHSEPRPDLVSLALEPFMLLLLFRWRKEPTRKLTLGIALVMFLWSNVHVSSIMGYLMIGAFLIDRSLRLARAKNESWIPLIATSVLWSLVGFLNVDLMHPLLQQGTVEIEWVNYITEYETVPFAHQFHFLQAYWVVLFFAFIFMLRRKEWAGAFLTAAIALKTAELTKLFPHLIALTLPFVAGSCEDLLHFSRGFARGRTWATRAAQALLLLVTAFALQVVIDRAFLRPLHPVTGDLDRDTFPAQVTTYAKEQKLSGRIFNEYSAGGYLLFELAPEMKVYVDGRSNILYPLDLVKRSFDAQANVADFKREANRYGINYVIGRLDGGAFLVHTALESGDFNLRYIGGAFALLEKASATYPTASRSFLHPECLELTMKAKLETELAKTPGDSFLSYYLKASLAGLDGLVLPPLAANISFYDRLRAEFAWRRADLAGAELALLQIPMRDATDAVNLAEINCEIHGCEAAEAILDHTPAIGLTDFTLHRVLSLLNRIEATKGLKIFTPERIERTKKRASNKWDFAQPLDRRLGCAETP